LKHWLIKIYLLTGAHKICLLWGKLVLLRFDIADTWVNFSTCQLQKSRLPSAPVIGLVENLWFCAGLRHSNCAVVASILWALWKCAEERVQQYAYL